MLNNLLMGIGGWIAIIAVVVIIVALVGWYISTRNGFVRLKNKVEEAWATIDVYLKKRFCFAEDGKVVIRPVRKVFSDWRKLLKKHCQKYRNGEMTIYAVRQSYNCRYGMYSHFDCKKSLHEMDKLYMRLFDEMPNGQTIDDIRMRKNLYHYKDMYLRGEISLTDIGIKYTDWKETAEWYEEKKRVVKDMNKLVYKLFHITWNKSGGKNEGCNIIGCKRYQKIAC